MEIELLKEINILTQRKIVIWLNIWSIIIFIFFFIIGLLVLPDVTLNVTLPNLLLFIIVLFVLLCFHELIHGMFFKMFAPESKVKYGMKSGMFYAASPGVTYAKLPFMVIILMPFIIITCLLAMASLFPVNDFVLYLLFMVHTAGCVGDFYYIGVLNQPMFRDKQIVVEDTLEGIKIYHEAE
ncbi:DUF3267 domain-containing protein [Gracilibacillus alcaliphilus]|uniref:DUF3267 domain-containing protein n=1 Tax=Gracilibacillus alcaliphilus TaxID=1401441 RepID=UPI001956F787|nr:DUF3267 domain-containing protein [Gracilibacillus alcaliphilus]MBM7676064.1 putative neutral ceramidase superfamily lipid hydrolase [Gracilibacillus alcaliphilus]